MFLSGISDEAGQSIEAQIRAHQELGFSHIEMRTVNKKQFTQLDDGEFSCVVNALKKAGLSISCYGSAIGNWERPVTGDFQVDIDDLLRVAPRMKETGTSIIRVMSWPNCGLSQDAWKNEVVRRMKELCRLAEENDIVLGLENCVGYAAQSPAIMSNFMKLVDSPALKVIFDTGNAPCHNLNSMDYYLQVKPYIAYVHIKDSYIDSEGICRFTLPNHGLGYVRQILCDLHSIGYDGGISIEPHLQAVIHTGEDSGDAEMKYSSYVDYGMRVRELVNLIWATNS